MTLERKKTIVSGFIVLMMIWPLLHFVIVKTYDYNPWNGFGWAMYTTPQRVFEAVAVGPSGQTLGLAQLSPEDRDHLIEVYTEWKVHAQAWWPERPDAYARAVLEAHDDWATVDVVINRLGVDARSGLLKFTSKVYSYSRDGSAPVER